MLWLFKGTQRDNLFFFRANVSQMSTALFSHIHSGWANTKARILPRHTWTWQHEWMTHWFFQTKRPLCGWHKSLCMGKTQQNRTGFFVIKSSAFMTNEWAIHFPLVKRHLCGWHKIYGPITRTGFFVVGSSVFMINKFANGSLIFPGE